MFKLTISQALISETNVVAVIQNKDKRITHIYYNNRECSEVTLRYTTSGNQELEFAIIERKLAEEEWQ